MYNVLLEIININPTSKECTQVGLDHRMDGFTEVQSIMFTRMTKLSIPISDKNSTWYPATSSNPDIHRSSCLQSYRKFSHQKTKPICSTSSHFREFCIVGSPCIIDHMYEVKVIYYGIKV